MKTFLLLLTISLPAMRLIAQAPAFYHDPALDTIANNSVFLDSDVNGGLQQIHQDLTNQNNVTLKQQLIVSSIFRSGGSNVVDDQGTVFAEDSPQTKALTKIANAKTNAAAFSSFVSNAIIAPYLGGISSSNWYAGTADGGANGVAHDGIFVYNLAGHNFYIDLSFLNAGNYNSSIVTVATLVRAFVSAFVWLMFFVAGVHHLQNQCSILLGQNQTQGSSESVFGTNISAVTGLFYAAAITAGLAGIIGFFATSGSFLPAAFASGVTGGQAALHTVASTIPAWDVMTSFVPVLAIFGAFMNWLLFRYLYSWPLFLAVRGLIKFLIV